MTTENLKPDEIIVIAKEDAIKTIKLFKIKDGCLVEPYYEDMYRVGEEYNIPFKGDIKFKSCKELLYCIKEEDINSCEGYIVVEVLIWGRCLLDSKTGRIFCENIELLKDKTFENLTKFDVTKLSEVVKWSEEEACKNKAFELLIRQWKMLLRDKRHFEFVDCILRCLGRFGKGKYSDKAREFLTKNKQLPNFEV